MRTRVNRMAATAATAAVLLGATVVADAVAKEKKASKASKKSESGYIGVYMQELSDDVREGLDLDVTKGVLVSGVQDDSPADTAGIEEGDVVVSFAGTAVDSPDQLRELVSEFEPGATAKIDVVRDGKAQSFTVTVGERSKSETFSFEVPDGDMGELRHAFTMVGGPRLGISAHELEDDNDLGSYFGAEDGILVLGVEDESVAEKAGVKAGDVIQTIGDDKVGDVGDLREALRDFDEGDEFTIGVLRHGKSQTLKATMDEQEYSFFNGGWPNGREWRYYTPRAPRAPRVHVDRESLRDEIDDLKKEIQEMKEQLERDDS